MTSQLRRFILLGGITLAISGYVYLNLPLAQVPWIARVLGLGNLPGDLPWYANRFGSAFLLMGLVPMGLFRLLGWRWNQAYLRPRGEFITDPVYWVLVAGFLGVIALSAGSPPIRGFYPFSKTLGEMAAQDGWGYFLIHGVLYVGLYYLPWEILFRGILIGGLIQEPGSMTRVEARAGLGRRPAGAGEAAGEVPGRRDGKGSLRAWKASLAGPLGLAGVQVLPTVLLHINHPFSEVAGAVVFGLVAGLMVVRYRSILPVLVLHGAAGLLTDGIIIAAG
ncbi:CPBP family intramembrane glutamic endopeptidase [Spirochaeta lutea]|uniref:CAAX prenyl protease 2/Lysostaphin resistance protein A-like domain-containing protein n=1 Tax=Spirochaeta lutea TaxID=1480694 RepID=A0A098QV98_9SPIO|nr:CPBP family intramembrane glutamic endopeptidase [Spirochaeta lutea]KGE71659.1 hypothetical protein DC28_10355 [Spirochaeta lutea]